MADEQQTHEAIPVHQANRVIKVTTQRVLGEVRAAFRTMPAMAFSEWLQQQLEGAERLP